MWSVEKMSVFPIFASAWFSSKWDIISLALNDVVLSGHLELELIY